MSCRVAASDQPASGEARGPEPILPDEGPEAVLPREASLGAAPDDVLDSLREEIERRLEELRPARDEAARLERALQALRGSGPATPRPAAAPRAARGERAERLLRVVRARPGATQREVANAVGLTPAAVYGPVRRAVLKGQIVKRDGRLYPVEEETS